MKMFVAILALTLAGESSAGGPYYVSHDYEWTEESETPFPGCLGAEFLRFRGNRDIPDVDTVSDCLQLCEDEDMWPCQSIKYNTDNGDCHLLAASSANLRPSDFQRPCNENGEVTLYAERQLKDCRPTLGWKEFEGSCYKEVGGSSGTPDNWAAVREQCRTSSTDNYYPRRRWESSLYLADVGSEEENNFIANELLGGRRGWIGASKTLGESGSEFLWDNEENGNFLPVPDDVANWNRDQPSNTGGDEDCVEINRGPEGSGAWNDLPCRRKRLGVCKFIIRG